MRLFSTKDGFLKDGFLSGFSFLKKEKHKHFFRSVVFLFLILVVFSVFYKVSGATFIFSQSSWSDGYDSVASADHTSNQTNWTKFSTSTNVTAGFDLRLPLVSYSFTDDGATSTSPSSPIASGGGFANGTHSNTVVNGSGSGANISLSGTINTRTTMTSPGGTNNSGADLVYPGSGDYIYGNISDQNFRRYSLSGDSWTTMATPPGQLWASGGLYYPGSGDYIYRPGKINPTHKLYRYSISGNSWATMTDPPGVIGTPADLSAGGDYIYVLGYSTTDFYRYSISGDSWTTLTSAPSSVSANNSFFGVGDYLYILRGSNTPTLYRYSISGNSWSTMTNSPVNIQGAQGTLTYPGSGDYLYVTDTNGSGSWYRYSISGNSWDSISLTTGMYGAGATIVPGPNNYLYGWAGYLGAGTNFYRYKVHYDNPGVFTSAVINLGNAVTFSTITYSTTLNGQTISLDARAGNTPTPDGTWTSWQTGISSGSSIAGLSGNRYIQYRANFGGTELSLTPTLNSVTINYSSYPSSGNLISSIYNTGDSKNLVSGISWTETGTSSNEIIKFQIRSASSLGGIDSASWCGTSITCDGNSYFTINNSSNSLPSNHPLRSGEDDQYFQYKVFISSGGSYTPILTSVTIQYVVNSPPEFDQTYGTDGLVTLQSTTTDETLGLVQISYKIRDVDTDSGTSNPGYITPSFEYNIGGGWVPITSQYLSANALDNKVVSEVGYNTYSLTWDAKAQIPGSYTSTAKIRVTINDNEAANNIAISTSSNFIIDTTAPVVSFKMDGALGIINFNATDTSFILDYNISNNSDFSSSTTGLGTSSIFNYNNSWSFVEGTTSVYVYSTLRDVYGNTATTTITGPSKPDVIDIRDVSSASKGQFKEFILWPVYPSEEPEATFMKYELYRSTDNSNFSLLQSITNPSINYYLDEAVASSTVYYYKVRYIDSDSDISNFTTVVSDLPDGQGGTDYTLPTISNVVISDIKNTSAKITWTTDELSNSSVDYGSTNSYGAQTTSQSFVTSHSLYLNNLTPNTQYYLRVKSTDVSSNLGINDNNGPSYTFNTVGGPVISNVTISDLSDDSATIFWNTNTPTDGFVMYGTDSSLATYTEAGSATIEYSSTTPYQHKVTITGLNSETRYYFKVKSTDESSNLTIDDNNGQNYNFLTTYDTRPPAISEVTVPVKTSNSAVITWTTDELSTSQVEYGTVASTTSGSYSTLTQNITTPTIYHSMTLSSETLNSSLTSNELTKLTTYYFRVKSVDLAGNIAVSDEGTFTTADTGQTVVVNNYIYSGGGGGYVLPQKDETPPKITDVKVSNITPFGAIVNFKTDEDSRGLVQYGVTDKYGQNSGGSVFEKNHSISLKGLTMGTEYNFMVNAIDKNGNVTFSENVKFKTPFLSQDLGVLSKLENNVDSIQQKIEEIIESALPSINPPFISKPEVDSVGQDFASIVWKTNVKAYGAVLYSDDFEYSKDGKYVNEVSNTKEKLIEHRIDLNNLKPNTKYHVSVSSYVFPEAKAKTEDMIFTTKASDVQAQIMDKKKDSFRVVWTTSDPTTSVVEYKKSGSNQTERKQDLSFTNYHDIKIDRVTPATTYKVRAYGLTVDGNTINSRNDLVVTTTQDVTPPSISNFKVDNAIVPGRSDKIQTVVSWKTDEPSTSVVYYDEGVGTSKSELRNKQEDISELTENHVVILTNLKPGTIYRFQVASTDDANNTSKLPIRTIITPKQNESVTDVILKNFDDTFNFISKPRR